MEILQFLISFLSKPENVDKFSSIINAFNKGQLSIDAILKNIDLKTLLPVIQEFLMNGQNKSPTEWVEQGEGLSPIANVADKDIVYALNKYLCQPI